MTFIILVLNILANNHSRPTPHAAAQIYPSTFPAPPILSFRSFVCPAPAHSLKPSTLRLPSFFSPFPLPFSYARTTLQRSAYPAPIRRSRAISSTFFALRLTFGLTSTFWFGVPLSPTRFSRSACGRPDGRKLQLGTYEVAGSSSATGYEKSKRIDTDQVADLKFASDTDLGTENVENMVNRGIDTRKMRRMLRARWSKRLFATVLITIVYVV